MMPAFRLFVAVALLGVALPARAQERDSTMARVQRLVNAGDRPGARQLADSLVAAATEGSPEYGEALFARAFASSSAAEAERDYLRVSVEYPFSSHAEDATMMVAQLKLARGDRTGARRNFERLVREHPGGTQVAKAAFWAGRLALEDGDMAHGCPSLGRAREAAPAEDVELANQIDYYIQRCTANALAAEAARAETTATPATPATTTTTAAPAKSAPSAPSTPAAAKKDAVRPAPQGKAAREYSVQVAAFPKQRDAEALAEVLRQRGYAVRVWGDKAPFRVRVGRYPSRDEAEAARGRMKASRVNGIVVEAERR